MAALQTIDATVLRSTLLSLNFTIPGDPPTVVYPVRQLVLIPDSAPPIYKIYWEHADEDTHLPYITTHHIMGGKMRHRGYSDTTWKVVGHTADMDTAMALADAISMLDKTAPITSAWTGVCGYHYIEESMPVFDRYQGANQPFFVVGGLYRLRLNLGDY